MPVYQNPLNVYAQDGTLATLFPAPIIAQRDPGNSDIAAIGQNWVNTADETIWCLVAYNAGVPVWVTAPLSDTTVAELTIDPGDLTITAGDIVMPAGSIGLTDGNIQLTNGNLEVTNGATSLANTTVSGTTLIHGSTGINGSVGDAFVTVIGNSTAGLSVSVLSTTTITEKAPNILINNTGTGATSIGGSTGGSVSIKATHADGIFLGTGDNSICNVAILAGVGSSANIADTYNSKVGTYTLSNAAYSTLAGGGVATFTMTNSQVTAGSTGCICTAASLGTNVTPLAVSVVATLNTLTFYIKNTAAATAVNGNVELNFWVLN